MLGKGRVRIIRSNESVADGLKRIAKPLASASDLDPLMDAIGDARYVLLGEASHGTSEFYTWRTEISKRLIEERGFSFIAVEGDWPDCYRVNRYVKGLADSGVSARRRAARVRALADVDVGEPRGRRARRVAARAQRRPTPRRAGRLLRPRRLLALGLDARSHGVSRARRPGSSPPAAQRAYRLLRAVRRGRAGVRARDGARADVVRGRGGVRCCASCARRRRDYRDDGRRGSSTPSRTRSSRGTPSCTTARWCAAARRRGTCATTTWSRRSTG